MDFKQIFKNLIFPLLGVLALLNFYKDFSFHKFVQGLHRCNFYWVAFAAIMHWLNHFLRAYRWRLLLNLRGFSPRTWHCILAEMTGFFTNLLVPRLGEWTRCTTLKNMENIPVKESLPTVIVERVIDIFVFTIIFISVCIASFFLKKEMIRLLFSAFWQLISYLFLFFTTYFFTSLLVLILIGLALLYLYKLFRVQVQYFWKTCVVLFHSAKSTLFNVKSVMWLVTFLIWLSYLLVEYISCFALEDTSQLSFFSIFFVFIVISLSSSIPMPGSMGVYQILLYPTLAMFKVPEGPAMIYVTVIHGVQIFNQLVIGGGCAIVSRFVNKKPDFKDMSPKRY